MKFQLTIRGLVFTALFSALMVVFGFINIHLGFTPVPITLQTFAIMLTGAFLGPWYGFFSVLLVMVLAILGLPFVGGTSGLSVLVGPSAGYAWTWPFAALFIGWASAYIKGKRVGAWVLMFLVMEVFGSLIMYLTGVPWLAHAYHITSMTKALVLGCYPYLPGDVLKALVATAIVMPVREFYPTARLVGKQQTQVVDLR